MKVYERLLGGGDNSKRSLLTLNDLASVFAAPDTAILPSSWGNIGNEELIGSWAEAYEANGPVFALVLARMQVFSQARFQWTRWAGGTAHDLFGSSDLGILEYPWPGGTTADLLARMEVDASLAGNAFIRRVRNDRSDAGRSGLRDRLVRLRPEWCTILLGSNEMSDEPWLAADVEFAGVVYRPNGSREGAKFFTPDEVAHYAPLPDPIEHFRGMSWVRPVIRTVTADDASEVHKRMFFQHAATPNFAIKYDPSIGIDDVREFKELLEAEHKGVLNAYKTLYLGGGADPVTLGKDFQQMAFAETQGKGESRLAAAAGVPPSWVGFSEGLQGSALNAGNFTAARRRFADGTLAHLWAAAARSLEPLVDRPQSRQGEPPAQLWYDTRGIPFLREDAKDHASVQQQEATTIQQLITAGFTPDSAVQAVKQSDWSQLVHSGLVSVQLQAPGAGAPDSKEGAPNA